MAGDWIPMRLDLVEDPAVMWMAEKLEVREEVVVGYCHAFWSWVSRQCHAGSVTHVTLVSLGRRLNLPGFPELLCQAGWLEYQEVDGVPQITIPHFDYWLSQTAKSRLLASRRKQQQRNKRHADVTLMSRCERDKSVTTVQESREYKDPPIVPQGKGGGGVSKGFTPPTVAEVRAYCEERKNGIDPEEFIAYYESRGWAKIKSWQACVITWEKRRASERAANGRDRSGWSKDSKEALANAERARAEFQRDRERILQDIKRDKMVKKA